MHSTEEIKSYITSTIDNNAILAKTTAECITNQEDEQQIDIALHAIKDNINTLTQDPKEVGLFLDELQQLKEKGLSHTQIEQFFQQQRQLLQQKILDANTINIPKNETQALQKQADTEYQHKKEEVEVVKHETNENLTTLKNQLSLEQYLLQTEDKITNTKKRLRFLKSGESRELKDTVNHIIERLKKAEKLVDRFKRYEKKFGREDIKAKHIQAMCIKLNTILADSNDYISQGITGDLDEANKFFPPNFFDDAGFYTPDVVPSDKTLTNQVGNLSNNGKPLTVQDQQYLNQYNQACENGNQKSGMKALGSLIDNKLGPMAAEWGVNPKVVTGAAKLGLLAANGAMLWNMGKSVRGLIFPGKDGDRSKALKNLLINGGLYTALNFTDPEKALAKGKELRGRVSGDASLGGNKGGTLDMSSAMTALNNPNTLPEQKILYGSNIVGVGLSGVTYNECAAAGIFCHDGAQHITRINTEALAELYKTKWATKPEYRNQMITYVNNIEKIQKENPKLIEQIMHEHHININDLNKTEFANTIIGGDLMDTTHKAKIFSEAIQGAPLATQVEGALKTTKPNPVTPETLGASKFAALTEGIMKSSPEFQKQIIAQKITFESIEGKLKMHANGEQVELNLSNYTHALQNKSGNFVPFADGAKDVEELLQVTYTITEAIHNNKGKFMVDKPLFYNKNLGERGHSICATSGPSAVDKPTSWISGQYVKLFDAQRPLFGLGGDQRLEKFENENILASYTSYLNTLGIWKGETAQDFIDTEIKTKIAKDNPNLSPAEQEKILANYLGLYNTRGDLGAFATQNWQDATKPLVNVVDGFYTQTKDAIKPHYKTIKTRTKERTQKGRNKIEKNSQEIYTDTKDFKTRIADKRDNHDTVLKQLVKAGGINLDKIENLTFKQLPQGIGNLIGKIIAAAGGIVYYTGEGIVNGIKGPNANSNETNSDNTNTRNNR